MAVLQIQMFGNLAVKVGEDSVKFRTKKTAHIFAFLAIGAGKPTSRATLAEVFWPDSPWELALQNVRMALSDIRKSVGPEHLFVEGSLVWLAQDGVECDVWNFERLLTQAKKESNSRHYLSQAVEAFRGQFMEDVSDTWVYPERIQLNEKYAITVARLIDAKDSGDDWNDLVLIGQKALQIVGCREDLHLALVRLFLAQDLPSRAIQQFEELERSLDETWGEPPSKEAFELLEKIPVAQRYTSRQASSTRTENLGLYGRDDLIQDICQTLSAPDSPRLICLTGPGGVGKSSVAHAVLKSSDDFGKKRWFVELHAEQTGRSATQRVQQTMGLNLGEFAQAYSSIASHVGNGPSLLILDNCEHLVTELHALLDALLDKCHGLVILATSRTQLRHSKEHPIPVGPLALPSKKNSFQEALSNDSVLLFERDARIANPTFRLSTDNIEAVKYLCQSLDGLPLAIKLAAACTMVQTPAQTLAKFQSSFETLAAPKGKLEERHASLSRVFEASFDLLSDESKSLAMDASLFVGNISSDIIDHLRPNQDSSATLIELVRSSFLVPDTNGESASFAMLESIRSFLQSKLASSPRCNESRQAHLAYWLQVVQSIESSREMSFYQKIEAAFQATENCISGIQYCIKHELDLPLCAALFVGIVSITQKVQTDERFGVIGLDFYQNHASTLSPVEKARLGWAYLRTVSNRNSVDEVRAILDECQGLASNDPLYLAHLGFLKGGHFKSVGQYTEADECYRGSLAYFRTNDLDLESAKVIYALALNAYCQGDLDKSVEHHLEALRLMRTQDDPPNLIWCLFDTASGLAELGRGAEAVPMLDEAVDLCQKLGSNKLEGLTRWQKADVCLSMDNPVEALEQITHASRLVLEGGFETGLKWMFLKVSEALIKNGHAPLAINFLAKGYTQRNQENRPLAVYEQKTFDLIEGLIREKVSTFTYDRYWSEGQKESWPTLVAQLGETNAVPS